MTTAKWDMFSPGSKTYSGGKLKKNTMESTTAEPFISPTRQEFINLETRRREEEILEMSGHFFAHVAKVSLLRMQ